MNNTLKKLIKSEGRGFLTLIIIFAISLITSAFIYVMIGKSTMKAINYESIRDIAFMEIFQSSFKKNIIYFLALIFLTCIGQTKLTKILFSFISLYYGLSIIYTIKTIGVDYRYFLLTFTDYFIFFPFLLYFTFISSSVSKYTRKAKNIETISHKFDIIISSYIRISLIYLAIVTAYTFLYSFYVLILSRLMVV